MMWAKFLLVTGCLVSALALPSYYNFDGTGNNVDHPEWGAANTDFLRLQTQPAYADGLSSMAVSRPTPRDVSYRLILPAYRNRRRNYRHATDMLTYIGQFFNHDIDLKMDGSTESEPIGVPSCDFYYDRDCTGTAEIPYHRSAYNTSRPSSVHREQINTITSFLDGSVVYGVSLEVADKLRAHYRGKMSTFNGQLPINYMSVPMVNPAGVEGDSEIRAAGDVRANVNPILLAIQSLFLREHNRLADKFSNEHPEWTDEQVYQKARKFVTAYMQSICYREYLPMLGLQLPPYTGYKSTVQPGVDTFFATVSYRYAHSEVMDVVYRIDDDGYEIPAGHLLLYEAFFQPTKALSAGIEPLLRGASFARQAEVDPHFSISLQHFLFKDPKHGGQDLMSISIQRGRDHGIPDYNSARVQLGLKRKTTFAEITSDLYVQKKLKEIYGDVNSIDPYIGGLAEDPHRESNVGELFYVSMVDQYARIRDGDRFYYENSNNGLFTQDEIADIRTTGLRDIILRNTDIDVLPENIYIQDITEPWPRSSSAAPTAPTPGAATPVGTPTSPGSAPAAKASRELKSNKYSLQWEVENMGGEEYIRFTLTVQANGWVGLGIAKDASSAMVQADVMVAKIAGGVVSVDDYWADTFDTPKLDTSLGGTNDIQVISGSESGGTTTVEFRRKLSTGDVRDRDISKSGETPVIFAWHTTSDDLIYHTAARRGKTTIDFFGELPVSTPASPQVPSAEGDMGGQVLIDALSGYTMSWTVRSTSAGKMADVSLRIRTSGPAYMVFGLEGAEKGFTNADAVVVQLLGTMCTVKDYWFQTRDAAKLDSLLGGSDDVTSVSCTTTGGYLQADFTRPVTTIDPLDRPLVLGAFTDTIFAWNVNSPELVLDGTLERRLKINFFAEMGSQAWMPAPSLATPAPTSPAAGSPVAETPATTEEPAEDTISGEVTLDETTEFVLKWELGAETMKFDMSFKGEGFAAIGIPGEDRNMHNADIFIAAADGSGGCTVGDYWSETFAEPSLDEKKGGQDDLTDKDCVIEDGYIKSTFRRPLAAGDDVDRDIPDSKMVIIYAFHTSSDGIAYHGPTGRGVVDVTLDAGTDGGSGGSPEELLDIEFEDGASKELAEGYTVWWKLVDGAGAGSSRRLLGDVSGDQEIIIKMQRESTGWMGMGIEPADATVSGMQDTDMYIGWVEDDGTVMLLDAWAIGFLKPEADEEQGGTNDILMYAGEEKDGVTTIVFRRKIDTGDAKDRVIKDTDQDIVFAFGDSDGLPPAGHGPCCRGKDKNNFTVQPKGDGDKKESKGSGEAKEPSRTLIVVHAWLMMLAWAFLCVLGLVMSRLSRHWKYWMEVHIVSEVSAVIISVLGEIFSFTYSQGEIRYAHGALSFIILFCSFPQLFLGRIALKSNIVNIKKLHRAVGYFIVGVAFWQMWMGMKILEVDDRLVQCYYAWIISIGVSFHFASGSVSKDEMYVSLVKRGFLPEDPEAGVTAVSGKATTEDERTALLNQPEKNKPSVDLQSQKSAKHGASPFTFSSNEDSIPAYKAPAQKSTTKSSAKSGGNAEGTSITASQFMENVGKGKPWTLINKKVYDMQNLLHTHPGGPESITDIIGKDGTDLFMEHHAESETAHRMLNDTLIGNLQE